MRQDAAKTTATSSRLCSPTTRTCKCLNNDTRWFRRSARAARPMSRGPRTSHMPAKMSQSKYLGRGRWRCNKVWQLTKKLTSWLNLITLRYSNVSITLKISITFAWWRRWWRRTCKLICWRRNSTNLRNKLEKYSMKWPKVCTIATKTILYIGTLSLIIFWSLPVVRGITSR